MPQPCNLDGISMNIQDKNSACYFLVQSEREQTLVGRYYKAADCRLLRREITSIPSTLLAPSPEVASGRLDLARLG